MLKVHECIFVGKVQNMSVISCFVGKGNEVFASDFLENNIL